MTERLSSRRLLWCAVALLSVWMCVTTPLLSEECYYWAYGRHLDWSYFDHPPMVAWLIRLGTSILGETTLGVRLACVLMGLGTTWVGLRWLRELGVDARAGTLWIALSLGIPLLAAVHVFATPDASLTFFFCSSAFVFWKATQSGRRWHWALAGALAGLAMLSKYTAVFLAPGLLLQLALDGAARRRLRVSDLALATACALGVFTPVLYWNWQHDWVSFLFQSNARYSAAHLSLTSVAQFGASQLLLVSPVLLWTGWCSLRWAVARARAGNQNFLALAAYGLPLPLFLLVNALVVEPKEHWAIPAYVPLALLISAWWFAEGRQASGPLLRGTALAWISLSLGLCCIAPLMRWLPQHGGTHWDADAAITARALEQVAKLRAESGAQVFLFTSSHRDSAELLWGQHRASSRAAAPVPVLAGNVLGRTAKQFDFWDDPERLVGWDAVYVLDQPVKHADRVAMAREHFESFTLADSCALSFQGHPLREIEIYVGRGYLGPNLP